MYNDNDDNNIGVGLLIIFSILLIPVIPAGDVSIYLIDTYIENAPNIVYIVGYVLFSGSWGYMWFKILSKISDDNRIIITGLYIQGIVFILLICETEAAHWSFYIGRFIKGILIGN